MNVIVSGVSIKDGKRIAYVQFNDEGKCAEAIIPDCEFISNEGFSDEELNSMKDYLIDNLATIKRTAASVNPISALMK